jgi:hypothetical protein
MVMLLALIGIFDLVKYYRAPDGSFLIVNGIIMFALAIQWTFWDPLQSGDTKTPPTIRQ